MKIFISGVAGSPGSHMADAMIKKDHHVLMVAESRKNRTLEDEIIKEIEKHEDEIVEQLLKKKERYYGYFWAECWVRPVEK